MNRAGSLFPLLLVGLLAMGSFWLEHIVSSEDRSGLRNVRHEPDTMVENFTVDHFDARGQLQSQLVAQQLQHFPDDDSSELDAPIIRFLGEGRLATFTARKAFVSSRGEQVLMREDVRGDRPPQNGSPRQTLTTEELLVRQGEELARTDKPFVLTHGNLQIQGVGGEWDNLKGQFRVFGQLQAEMPGQPTQTTP
ncbi:MAG: LPS export ABC transporter periplasmic protein LptC [Candidatus Dactylopiibacterium carminicum]|uniref:LPS export ABC transporter periplasmic protein LptC n=1 Tax=Candidatus Dactylopiibacterium carminicum TaxID=857335 RepID=A0A272ERL7_9RHOO|nr:LPS export ABC transporter periplasmic protein LptC [Candidatus Dactylopiibacterium carminicum]KAF7598820.1 LPS export ABC transporter periplasmic protein LptC [Candidatus Dactylopiibacterium carminicum]PAS92724.1 MAG: LPS export ABC transporter periplasmic protein LptC [Candidatus Dactylopiibacterium carminicum]PAS96172.1 MAG: LPS export ABC transporter periplasmic protein LptC [Candidatus Dactylopiibacterium carminicum]PAS98841.1 MAG: LPS export ABC transporter periplasmic protein LptC [Ca